MIFKNTLNTLIDKLLAFVADRVGFWSSGLHDFVLDEDSVALKKASEVSLRKWVIVVSRGEYFESVKDYPVGSLRDLKKVIKNEPWRFPFEGKHFFMAERLSVATYRVTSWVLRQEIFDDLKGKPFWVLPETICFEVPANGRILEVERLGELLFIADTPDGIVSSLGHKGAFLSVFGRFADRADLISGKSQKLTGSDAPGALMLGAFRMLRFSPHRFFVRHERVGFKSYPWSSFAVVSSFIFASYLTVTSAYLMIAGSWIDYRLTQTAEATAVSLDLRARLAELGVEAGNMTSALVSVQPLWIAWDVFLDLRAAGVILRAVNSTNGEVTYFATAIRGTDVLATLSADPRVEKAVFSRPVKQVGTMQQFAVKVSFFTPDRDKIPGASLKALPELAFSRGQSALGGQSQGGGE